MTPADIKKLLPEPNQENYERLKKEHPYSILNKYGNAIGEKYPGKLDGILTETTDASSENLVGYALYILAAIGKGYSYRLLEVTPTTGNMYPLKITIYEKNPQELKPVNNYLELEKTMNQIFTMGFTQTILMNLVAQVDLYNELRNEKS